MSRVVGIGSLVLAIRASQKDLTTGNVLKVIGTTFLTFAKVNPFLAIGIGVLDVMGVTDKIYNKIGEIVK